MADRRIESLVGKRVLVTGGAGFIGSNLVDLLYKQNNVTVLDNLSSGSLDNLAKSKDRITFIEGDILNKKLVDQLVAKTEIIFHLAANVGNVKSIENPSFDMDVNIRGTLNLLEASTQSKVERFVYSASSAIFGDAKYLPMDENHPITPESPYAVSKLAAEKYCFAFNKVHGIPTTAVRYFNVYGPRQDSSGYSNVVPIFLRRIKEGKPIVVFGDGEQTRDFVFVGDVAAANILAATVPGAIGESFNIGTGIVHTINSLIKIINRVIGGGTEIEYAPARLGEVRHSQANIDKAKNILGYSPTIDLTEGLRQSWNS